MACVLCGSVDNPTDEDVIPKRLLRAFDVQEGPTTVNVREESSSPQEVRKLRRFQFTLNGGLCKKCNNEPLAGLEQAVQPLLEPMAVRCKQTVLDVASQRLLTAWAVKTVYLLELASRQQFPGARQVEGYQPTTSEIGWLLAQLEQHPVKLIEPPPRSMVWMACWDCKKADAANRASMLNYAPSTAPVPTPDGGEVGGQFTTLAIGFAVFQVFTVDYVEADVRKAAVWNTGPPNSVRRAIRLIWPHRLRAGDVTWPRRPSRTTALTVWSIGTRRGAA